MTREELVAKVQEMRPDLGEEDGLLLADGFEDAFVGVVERFGGLCVACYDREKCLDILMKRDGMSYEEADEFFEFNTAGAWVGERTPAFLSSVR